MAPRTLPLSIDLRVAEQTSYIECKIWRPYASSCNLIPQSGSIRQSEGAGQIRVINGVIIRKITANIIKKDKSRSTR
jgi:hypothetical protein